MNKRELSKYYHLVGEIKYLESRIKEIESSLVGSQVMTGMPKGTGVGDPVYKKTTLLIKLKDKLEERKSKSIIELEKIEDFIQSIDDVEIRIIFTKRYIDLKQWEAIAFEMGMSERNIYRKHKKYLKEEIK